MTKLTVTQALILSAGAQRRRNVALPLPRGLAGAAAKTVVARMIELGWLREVEADLRLAEPLWCETGDGNGTTLVVTEAGLDVVGIAPMVAHAMDAVSKEEGQTLVQNQPNPRAGTKQAMLIEMLRGAEGATISEMSAATGWQAHTVRGTIAGVLKKRLGCCIASEKTEGRGPVYRIR